MSWYSKVAWSDGLFLRPQLFQQQERYLEYQAHKRASTCGPFFWGFERFHLDNESLSLGKLVLTDAAGIFPDGTVFDLPAHATPPAPLTIAPEHLDQVIHLAIAARAPNGEETSFDDEHGSVTSLARFAVFDAELRDANSIGQGARTVQLAGLRLRLLAQRELTDAWIGLPVARVTTLRSDGSVVLDSRFTPPVTRYGASPLLTEWVGRLQGLCRLRAEALATRLSGNEGKAGDAAEVADFLLLQILNRCDPVMTHWIDVPDTPPETIYILLRALAGELSTFVRTGTRRSHAHPPYRHIDPASSFKALAEDVQALLNESLIRSAQAIALERRGNGLQVASIAPAELQGFASLVLAVAAHLTPDQLSTQFAARCKVGPSDRLAELIRAHLPGLPLQPLPVPPRQIPFNAGFVYFQVTSHGALWDHLVEYGGFALHVAGELPGLRIELWGVREK